MPRFDDHAEIISTIKTLIRQISPAAPAEFADDANLFVQNILDSFGTIGLINELETSFDIALPTEDLTLENFSTVAALAALVARHAKLPA